MDSTDGAVPPASPQDVNMTSVPPTEAPAKDVPPVEKQIQVIEGLVKDFDSAELEDGTVAYLVSRRWLVQAQALGSGDAAKVAKAVPQGHLGPVDNADIIDSVVKDIDGKDTVRLKQGASLENFELFPQSAWDLLMSWYGLAKGQLPIVRVAHNTSPASLLPNVQFELHPPVFTLHRLWSVISSIDHEKEVANVKQAAPVIMCTSSYNMQAFLKKVKDLLHIPISRHVRVWRVPRKLPASNPARSIPALASLSTPPDSPRLDARLSNPQDSWSLLLLEVTDFMKLEATAEREQLLIKDLTHDENYNGRQTLAFVSLTVDQTLVLDENIERNTWVSTYRGKGNKDKAAASGAVARFNNSSNATAARSSGIVSTAASSGRSSPSHQGPVTRGRTKQKSGRVKGCVGLGNLGNTCYMNSALQCVRSVEELTKYFLVHENEVEINYDNPLGHGGHVANAYAHLLDEIYKDNAPSSVAPRGFKSTIGRYAPAFSGYGQQDSQEFLGFLLDGLQEDLSRVKKKPYIAKPDSTDEMISNPAAIREMADKVWDITKKRDDSIIADLFTGMYKSTLICPVCKKVSITFDPFTNLTLPLPIQNVWSKTIRFVPLNDRPVYLDVELDRTSGFRALKEFVSARVGVPADRLVGAEELRDNIIKVFDEFACVSEEITNNDTVVIHEVEAPPTNVTASKTPRRKYRSMIQISDEADIPPWTSPMADHLLVPVMHRFDPDHSDASSRRFKSSSVAGPAHFIVLTPEEARSEDVIRRKILEKVASFSTWPEFAKAEEESDASSNTNGSNGSGTDGVFSASDAGSSGSSAKVTAKSIESEDDMVDVTMKDAGETETLNQSASSKSKVLYTYNHRRPKWVSDTNMYLPGELQNLFEISFFSDSTNTIPVRWPSTNDDKPYTRLRTRVPQPPAPLAKEEASSPPWEGFSSENENENESVSEEAPTPEPIVSDVTRMVDESEEEDNVLPAVRQLAFRHTVATKVGGRRKKNKSVIKGLKRRPRPQPQTVMSLPQSLPQLPLLDGADSEDQPMASQETGSSETATVEDDGPLVRLGEGIVVDWSPDAWDAVYGKEGPDDHHRGEATYLDPVPVIDDPELREKKRNRLSRRKNGLTLDECLDEFEREEILSENDTWYCPRCKEHRRASKKFDLWKTPDILVVHLKRFSSSGWRRDKLDLRVDFPVVGLDLTKRVLDRQTGKHEIYDLIGVDDHWGGLGGGHYTAFAKNFVDEQWYEYNDSSVSRVSDPSRVVSASAYLLFYRRRSDVPLGGPRFLRIAEKYDREIAAMDSDAGSDGSSGEDRRLGPGSSLTGWSSASKRAAAGAGLAPRPVGLGSASGAMGGSSRLAGADGRSSSSSSSNNSNGSISSLAAVADEDHDYLYDQPTAKATGASSHRVRELKGGDLTGDSDSDIDAAPDVPRSSTGVLDFGSNVKRDASRDVLPWSQQAWSFGPLGSGSGNGHAGSSSGGSEQVEVEVDQLDLASAGSSPAAPPSPDPVAQAKMEGIQQQVWASKEAAQMHQVGAGGEAEADDGDSGKVVDIHLSEDETARMEE